MDGPALALFLIATFLGGLTSGFAGFAAGLVASGVWLHLFTPMQTATLIATYGIVNQSYAVWKLRRAFRGIACGRSSPAGLSACRSALSCSPLSTRRRCGWGWASC